MNPTDKITDIFRLSDFQKKALKKLGIETARDLLYHFPARYSEAGDSRNISELQKGDTAEIYGTISKLKTSKAWRKKIPMADGKLEDHSGSIKVVWFHQPYIAKMIPEGSQVRVQGKVSERKGELYITNPEIERVSTLPIEAGSPLFDIENGDIQPVPVYPESRGVSSRWFYHAIEKIIKAGILERLEDAIPEEILERYNLPKLKTALIWIHKPKKIKDTISARKRFAFEEIFFIQISRQKQRYDYQEKKSFKIDVDKDDIEKFIERFPFKPTNAQNKAIKDILGDLKSKHAMTRLLEGDVGSGKTFVAAATVYAVTQTAPEERRFGRLQSAYMAPTEILATQLFESFIEFFNHLPIQIGLITSSGCRKFPSKISGESWTKISRSQLLKWVKEGQIPILIGTHSLIQKTVEFENLAYVIIDEQHRFGTNQRAELMRKDDVAPHLLSMTATPIPRTLALTIYGDLDLTLLDEMPKGRKEIITEIVKPSDRSRAYEKVRENLEKGRQVYVICPRIDPPDGEAGEPDPEKEPASTRGSSSTRGGGALQLKSIKEEAKRLKKDVFPEYEIDILHGKMTPNKKDEVMKSFENGEIDILVSTSVVEVGVNVPNATTIVIEGADRFGLAQLHQLRGRVLRSTHQSYCFIFTDSKSQNTLKRLRAIKRAKNGFELAEYDLEMRGSGELGGKKQWGITDIGMEAIKNIKMVEASRKEAMELIKKDPDLEKHSLIKDRIKDSKNIHFE